MDQSKQSAAAQGDHLANKASVTDQLKVELWVVCSSSLCHVCAEEKCNRTLQNMTFSLRIRDHLGLHPLIRVHAQMHKANLSNSSNALTRYLTGGRNLREASVVGFVCCHLGHPPSRNVSIASSRPVNETLAAGALTEQTTHVEQTMNQHHCEGFL